MRFWTSSADGRRPLVQSWMTRSARGIAVRAVDDLVADVQRAQLLEHLLLALLGLELDLAPRRVLGLAVRLALGLGTRLGLELARLVHELVALAQELVHVAEGVDHHAGERGLLLLGELLLVDVHDVLHGGITSAQAVAQLAE